MPPIRYALLHDFDALNKVESVGMDTWHELIDKPEAALTKDELTFLDEVAAATMSVDTRFGELRALHKKSDYGRAVGRRLARVA